MRRCSDVNRLEATEASATLEPTTEAATTAELVAELAVGRVELTKAKVLYSFIRFYQLKEK
jgi:hypothetical protein